MMLSALFTLLPVLGTVVVAIPNVRPRGVTSVPITRVARHANTNGLDARDAVK